MCRNDRRDAHNMRVHVKAGHGHGHGHGHWTWTQIYMILLTTTTPIIILSKLPLDEGFNENGHALLFGKRTLPSILFSKFNSESVQINVALTDCKNR